MKTALITGAGQGIGLEIARLLAQRDHHVILNDLDPGRTEQAVAEIQASARSRILGISGDAGDVDFIHGMTALAMREFKRLDVAIANAGITLFGDFWTYSPDNFQNVMCLNAGGTFFLAQSAAGIMKTQPTGGSLLFTSSVTALQAHQDLAAYAMSKAAIQALARSLVVEVSQYRINVNTISPGATLTERTAAEQDYERIWSRLTPMGRPGTPQDIAHAAAFLVSDEARHITGQNLVVDGGWSSTSPSPYSAAP